MLLHMKDSDYSVRGTFPDFDLNWESEDRNVTISLKYPFPDFQIDGSFIIEKNYNDYSVHIFKKRSGIDEHDFFQACSNSECFGFIFPIKLFDDSFDFIQNVLDVKVGVDLNEEVREWCTKKGVDKTKYIVYSKVLFPAFRLLLEHAVTNKVDYEEGRTYYITDFYDKDTYVLLCNNSIIVKDCINISDLYPSLLLHNFVPILAESDFSLINEDSSLYKAGSAVSFTKLDLSPIAPVLATHAYIKELFESIIKLNLPHLMRFHLLYQVMELLINKIGIDEYNSKIVDINLELNSFISGAVTYTAYRDAIDRLNDLKEKLQISETEKKRINTLVKDKAIIMMKEHPELSTAIDAIQNSRIIDDNLLGEKVYFIRNLLVHGYHSLKISVSKLDDLIADVNIHFEKLIVSILIKYK